MSGIAVSALPEGLEYPSICTDCQAILFLADQETMIQVNATLPTKEK